MGIWYIRLRSLRIEHSHQMAYAHWLTQQGEVLINLPSPSIGHVLMTRID
jgi:hypothetical protein